VYQQRPRDVSLNDDGAFLWYLGPAMNHADTTAASGRRRFDDPLFLAAILLPYLTKQGQILRQQESTRHEAEFPFAVFNHHVINVARQSVLPADLETSGDVIDLLELSQFLETGGVHVFAPATAPIPAFLHQPIAGILYGMAHESRRDRAEVPFHVCGQLARQIRVGLGVA